LTTLASHDGNVWTEVPFLRTDDHTLTCHVTPRWPGFHSYRAEFSLDGGTTWLRDTVPDAWALVDPPQVDGLCLYTLIPAVSGTIADWTADLPRIRAMGFNAIHLLPITTMDTSESPYAAEYLFGIDPRYLSDGAPQTDLSQFEAFVERAKSLNLRLCFDLVLNHVGVNGMMTRHVPDWIVPDQNQPDGFRRAGYWSQEGWLTWNDIVLINYEHPSESIRSEIWAYMTEYALFWAQYADYTGGLVRLDNLHSSDPDFVRALTTRMRSEYPDVCYLAEYFTDESTLLRTVPDWQLNLLLATPWGYKFVPDLREYLKFIHREAAQVLYFMPITSHDSGTPAQEFGSVDSTVPRYVCAALMGTGVTGIPQGVEFGAKERVEFIGRRPKMEFPDPAPFGEFIAKVNSILTTHAAFRRAGNCEFVDGGHPAIIASFRRDPGTHTLGYLVACNFDIYQPQQISIDLSAVLETAGPFVCLDLLSGEDRSVPGPQIGLTLGPCTAQVIRFSVNPAT
jgi:hypothetical protein